MIHYNQFSSYELLLQFSDSCSETFNNLKHNYTLVYITGRGKLNVILFIARSKL